MLGAPGRVKSVAAATLQCDMGVLRVLSYAAIGRCLPRYMAHTVDVHAVSVVAHTALPGKAHGRAIALVLHEDEDCRLSGENERRRQWLPLQLPDEIGDEELPKFLKTLWNVFIEVSLCVSGDAALDLPNHLRAAGYDDADGESDNDDEDEDHSTIREGALAIFKVEIEGLRDTLRLRGDPSHIQRDGFWPCPLCPKTCSTKFISPRASPTCGERWLCFK